MLEEASAAVCSSIKALQDGEKRSTDEIRITRAADVDNRAKAQVALEACASKVIYAPGNSTPWLKRRKILSVLVEMPRATSRGGIAVRGNCI